MPAKARTHAPANHEAGQLLEQLIRERRPLLERIAARSVRQDQVDDAIQAACLGFLRTFDPATAAGGEDGAFRYLARSVGNSASKIIRGEARRLRGLPPAPQLDDDDPVSRAADPGRDPADAVADREEAAALLSEVRRLPDDQRRALVARAAGFEPAEIQRDQGLTSRQYRKRIEKARRQLSL